MKGFGNKRPRRKPYSVLCNKFHQRFDSCDVLVKRSVFKKVLKDEVRRVLTSSVHVAGDNASEKPSLKVQDGASDILQSAFERVLLDSVQGAVNMAIFAGKKSLSGQHVQNLGSLLSHMTPASQRIIAVYHSRANGQWE